MITYHHIGGRNGTYPLPLKKGPLLRDFHLILYDADENCYQQMQNAQHQDWGKISVYPYCIGGKTETSLFHLNFHPTTNSLYPFNEEFKDYNFVKNAIYGEYVFGDACKTTETVPMELLSLQDALSASQTKKIDFLSLDVQGAEYDIIEGAKNLLSTECIGIQLEVEFVKLYKDQKIFFDIHTLMESMGYELLDLDSFGRCSPISLPIGFRGLEQPLYAEAVYVKKFDEKIEDINFLYKCAFFCLIYKKIGACLKFLKQIDTLQKKNPFQNSQNYLYIECLTEIWSLYERSCSIKLPKLSQLFSNEKFQNYYSNNIVNEDKEYKNTIENLKKLLPTIKTISNEDNISFETILKKYKLDEIALIVKQNKEHEIKCFFELCDSII